MTPERWHQIEALYHAAQERGKRALADADPDLRSEVEALLEQNTSGILDVEVAHFFQSSQHGLLSPGQKLGPYEVLAPIGAGGMGQVYRAGDSRLRREVAIKVSGEQFSERFQLEAHAIAALNHPNICHLYDIGPNYLVMELIEGSTLAERIKQGAIPIEDALPIARQIAEALEAAHEKGIVHRDLKPGNIKITPDGVVKVLDFGLAKTTGTHAASSDDSPTFTAPQTEAGLILGTASYMAPEQAKGRPVDKRADIYAFGAVLYEMVTGRRLHQGKTTAEVLASVIKEEPQWDGVPSQVRRLLQRCLEKDPQKRLRHIGDVMALVDEVPSGSEPPYKPNPRWIWIAAGAAVLAVLGTVARWAPWRGQSNAPPIRFEIQPTASMSFINGGFPVVSPNGKWVVFPAIGSDGVARMWLRALDSVEIRPLGGTESGNDGPPPPFWSPDSRFIAFSYTSGPYSPGQLKKLDISGGPSLTICDVTTAVHGTWSREGAIVFADNKHGLFRVSAAGGVVTPITTLDASRHEMAHRFPQFLPDGRHFLYFRASSDPEHTGVFAGSIDSKPEDQSLKPVLLTNRQAMYAPSPTGGPGRLLFLRDSTLFAQPFDPARLQLSGEPVPVAGPVDSFALINVGLYSVSQAGVLGYRVASNFGQLLLTWFDRQGKVLGTVGDRTYYATAISPDETHVAANLPEENGNQGIWVLDLVRGSSAKLTLHEGNYWYPVWSPDGKSVTFGWNRDGRFDLYRKNADGSGEETLLLKSDQDKAPTSWSPDGRFLLYTTASQDVWVLPMQGDRKPFPILATPFREEQAHFSPDGHWIAYVSDESGSPEVYVRPFTGDPASQAASGGKVLISKDGGQEPRWRGDGRELFYRTSSLEQMAVDISAGKAFQAGPPRLLFKIPLNTSAVTFGGGDVATDGKRFLYPALKGADAPSPMIVVTNWQAALQK